MSGIEHPVEISFSCQLMIWVVVVTYNASPWILDCLQSINANDPSLDVIVIDNASTDNTKQLIRSTYPDVQIREQSINLGFGAANNIGIEFALRRGADYIFLLNQDATCDKKTIAQLIEAAQANPLFGILSPLHLNDDGDGFDSRFANCINELLPQLFIDQMSSQLRRVYDLHFVNAAAWLLSKDFVLAVGGFDPLFFMYGEDDDLANRCRFHGYKVGVVPEAHIYHHRAMRRFNKHNQRIDFHRMYAKYIKILKEPNRPWIQNIETGTRYLIGISGKAILHGDWNLFKNILRTLPQLIAKLSTAKKHHSLCQMRGSHFLSCIEIDDSVRS